MNNTDQFFTSSQASTLSIIVHISSSFSIVGAIFIIISFLAFPKERNSHSQLIFWLSVCDFGSSGLISFFFSN